MSDRQESLWYKLQGDSSLSRIAICAATGDSGNCCIMCVPCGHVFVDGKPFTDESDHIDSWELARQLYYHRCDMTPRPDRRAWSRGKLPK